MQKNLKKFTIRTTRNLFNKVEYCAEYEGETQTRFIKKLLKKHIDNFEEKHGEIEVDEIDDDEDYFDDEFDY